jgi:[ribosomal protein S5]-alanine N-acetyltransferase
MGNQSLRTARLTLAPYQPEDAEGLFAFMGDASAMQHTYIAPSLARCSERLVVYEFTRQTLGFAPWVVRCAQTGQIVGWGGLSVDPEDPAWGLEVSYAFSPAAWGRGYATELVRFSIGYAFRELKAPEVHAFAKPENQASIHVLNKSTFRFLRYEPSLERNHYLVIPAGM